MAKLAANTYGGALFDMSMEQGKVEEYAAEASVIRNLLNENPEFVMLLEHPQVSSEEKVAVIEKCFKGEVSEDILAFLVVIVKAGRQDELKDILSVFLEKVKTYKHIGVAYVTSAVELTDAQKQAVENRLLAITDNVSYEMHFAVDKTLIGGMRIRIGDKIVDSSLKTQLATMKKQLANIQLA